MPFLNDEQLQHFEEEGYLLLRRMLDVDRVIQPIIDEYHRVFDNVARDRLAQEEHTPFNRWSADAEVCA